MIRYAITFGDGEPRVAFCETMDDVVATARPRKADQPLVWMRHDAQLRFDGDDAPPSPPKTRRTRRRRKDSPAPEPVNGAPPGRAAAPVAGGTSEPGAAVLSCGGKLCRDTGSTVVHSAIDPDCAKLHPRKAAAR